MNRTVETPPLRVPIFSVRVLPLVLPDVLVERPASLDFNAASRAAIILEKIVEYTDRRSQGHGLGGHRRRVDSLDCSVFPRFPASNPTPIGRAVTPPALGSASPRGAGCRRGPESQR